MHLRLFFGASVTQQPDLHHEQILQAQGYTHIAGLDEAGRGAWAGPVVAGAVVLPLDRPNLLQLLKGVRDSKQCTPRQRDALLARIRRVALAESVGSVPAARIDEIGIVPATREAMTRAVRGLGVAPEALLIDALHLPELSLPQTALIKGDARSLSIAAASIAAKVTRDRRMIDLDERYGGYGLAQHKGYGTRQHRQALALLGPSLVHRLSYAPLRKLTGHTDDAIKVLTYNIHHWRGADDRVNVDRVIRAIAETQADVVGLNEVFHPLSHEGTTRDLLSQMAARLGMAFVFSPTNPHSDWGYVVGPYGNGLLSRYPIQCAKTIHLPHTENHYRRAVLRAELAVGQENWVVYVTHLNHLSERVRACEISALLDIIARHEDTHYLLIGDFNSLAMSDYADDLAALTRIETESQETEELLPLQVVPRLLTEGYVDAWIAAGDGGATGATWPASCPQVRIDYLFVPPPLRDRLVSCRVPDSPAARTASDHLPVLAEFSAE